MSQKASCRWPTPAAVHTGTGNLCAAQGMRRWSTTQRYTAVSAMEIRRVSEAAAKSGAALNHVATVLN